MQGWTAIGSQSRRSCATHNICRPTQPVTTSNDHGGRRLLRILSERFLREGRRHLVLTVIAAGIGLLLYGRFSDLELGPMLPLLVALRGAWIIRQAFVEPRGGADLAAEVIGLITFALLLPGAVTLYTRPFVFTPSEFGWLPPLVAAVSLGLYALPLLLPRTPIGHWRGLWWTLPALPAAAVVVFAVSRWHPYLNPLRADRQALAAQRVLSLRNNITAGAYVGWVVDYARTLEAQGDTATARRLYEKSLQLDPLHAEARRRLAALEPPADAVATTATGEPGPVQYRPDAPPHAPLWTAEDRAAPLERCRVDESLSTFARTGVVIVRAGAVPDWLVDVVGAVLGRELSLPVCVADPALVLPPPTRLRGLVIGDQWSVQAVLEGFGGKPLPPSPVVYLLLTGVPIYQPGTNFLFSRTFPWGALVSFDQFGTADLPNLALANRTAKSALGALLKTFGAPVSPDVDCVTSYSKSVQEIDAKGSRPSAAAFAVYRRELVARDRRWAARARLARGR